MMSALEKRISDKRLEQVKLILVEAKNKMKLTLKMKKFELF
jgi:hypothetical protein